MIDIFIKQLSVFIENRTGRLAEITGVLADNGVNIKALSIADTDDFGILRLIVDKTAEAYGALQSSGFRVKETEVVGITLGHRPGSLHQALKQMEQNDIFIEYMYDYLSAETGDTVMIIAKLQDQERAVKILTELGILSG